MVIVINKIDAVKAIEGSKPAFLVSLSPNRGVPPLELSFERVQDVSAFVEHSSDPAYIRKLYGPQPPTDAMTDD